MSKSKELTKAPESSIVSAGAEAVMGDLYGDITQDDLTIHYVNVVQQMSETANQDGVKVGDMYHGGLKKSIVKTGEKLKFVPGGPLILLRKEKFDNGRYVFKSQQPWPKDRTPEREEMEDGAMVRNYKVYKFYVHLKDDLEAGKYQPLTISFKSTSMKTGMEILTHIMEQLGAKKMPTANWMELSTKLVEKNGNKYYEFVFNPTNEEVEVSFQEIALATGATVAQIKAKGYMENEKTEGDDQAAPSEIPF